MQRLVKVIVYDLGIAKQFRPTTNGRKTYKIHKDLKLY